MFRYKQRRHTLSPVLVLDPNLVGWWRFEEGPGGVAVDYSGRGNHGALFGPSWVNGKVGGALSFDGLDDYMLVPHSTSLNIAGNVSLVAWIQLSTITPDFQGIVIKGASYSRPFAMYTRSKKYLAFHFTGATTHQDTTTPFSVDTWYHVAASFSDTLNVVNLYVNGVNVYSAAETTSPTANSLHVRVGTQLDSGAIFKGIIDELRIYDRALTVDEILKIYNDTK